MLKREALSFGSIITFITILIYIRNRLVSFFYRVTCLVNQTVHNSAFKPSRWDGNESNTLQDEHWSGFGQGPRACPGMFLALYCRLVGIKGTRWAFLTMKIMLVELLRVNEIEKCENTPEKVKLLQKGLRVVSDKPMIVRGFFWRIKVF